MKDTSNDINLNRKKVMGDIVGFWRPQMLFAASKLGVFEKLASSCEMSLEDLSKATHLEKELLSRLLDALVAIGYVKKQGQLYALDDLGKILLSELSHAPCCGEKNNTQHFQVFGGLSRKGKVILKKCTV